MISSLLVANRGEIARRVFRSCRRAGISTVAVFADPDAAAPHVADADRAVRLPGARAADTYLSGPALVAAALASGADAVHPGYGFLAEDAGFAAQVLAAGLTWVGPPPAAMEAMASKINARKIAAAAGVPVLPELDPGQVSEFPVLVKAAAGGGGRGMRVAADAAELATALASARREAQAAFGDGSVFCEPLLADARHVEIQLMADQAGAVWALTERDCSVQRRYQKVIEESPSPAVTTTVRRALRDAAASLAAAVGYAGAGTAEFLLTDSGEFWFLEFNTRLQVEHPVTELLHGVDLVALQLDIAQGLPLPPCPPGSGHAIQARLYAEDPAAGYRPSTGLVHTFAVPGVDVEFGLPAAVPAAPVLRLDSGTEPGTVVSEHYDALLGKVISWAPGRAGAIRRLSAALSGSRIHGPASNRDLLVAVLNDPVFRSGHATTALLRGYDLTALTPAEQCCNLSALAAAVADAAANRRDATVAASVAAGWRNVAAHPQRKIFDGPRGRVEVDYQWTRTGGIIPAGITRATANAAGDGADPAAPNPAVVDFTPEQVTIELAGVRYRFDVARAGAAIFVDSAFGAVQLALRDRLPPPGSHTEPGSLAAPMPGSVVRVLATAGDRVLARQPLIVIEAMKMEHEVMAPAAGVLTEMRVSAGAQVQAGDVLAILGELDRPQLPPEPELGPAPEPSG